MGPPASPRVTRVRWYSGSCWLACVFVYGALTLCGPFSQTVPLTLANTIAAKSRSAVRNPKGIATSGLASFHFARRYFGNRFSFSSSAYLDVSVQRVPSIYLCIQHMVTEGCSAGFPHSEISGSSDICSSPLLIAAYHVFLRLSVPRHPPCALSCLTFHHIVASYDVVF